MNTKHFGFRHNLIALAVTAACGPTAAQDAAQEAALTTPGSAISIGAGLGLGVRGKAGARINIGADVSYSLEDERYGQGIIGVNANPSNLPDIAYRLLAFKLFGQYALDRNSDVRLDLIHQRFRQNEWAWENNDVPFFLSDGTTVRQQRDQNVTFLGARYIYKWQ